MASKRRQRRKACQGKSAHADRSGALIAARRTTKYTQVGDWLRPYLCPHCHKWHVGHPQTREKRTRRKDFQ
jgi:hypothetical protein